MTAFADADDLTTCYDVRVLGQYLSDNGTALTANEVANSPKTAALLEQASGQILAFAYKGERYSEADLLALTGNGLAMLKRMTCDLAFSYILQRRGVAVDDYPQVKTALELLELLSQGKVIFPIAVNAEAGHVQSPPVTVQTIASQNYLTNSVIYFPTPRWTLNQLG